MRDGRGAGRGDGGLVARARAAPGRRAAVSTPRSSRTCPRTISTTTRTMEAYFDAKRWLFTTGARAPRRSVNIDDPYGRRLLEVRRIPWRRFACRAPRPICEPARRRGGSCAGSRSRSRLDVRRGLRGRFNVTNCLGALGRPARRGRSTRRREGVADVPGVPGRFEPIDEGRNSLVIVDYAHTPEASSACSRAARPWPRAASSSFRLRGRSRSRQAAADGAAAPRADLTHHERQPPVRGPEGDHRRDRAGRVARRRPVRRGAGPEARHQPRSTRPAPATWW